MAQHSKSKERIKALKTSIQTIWPFFYIAKSVIDLNYPQITRSAQLQKIEENVNPKFYSLKLLALSGIEILSMIINDDQWL